MPSICNMVTGQYVTYQNPCLPFMGSEVISGTQPRMGGDAACMQAPAFGKAVYMQPAA